MLDAGVVETVVNYWWTHAELGQCWQDQRMDSGWTRNGSGARLDQSVGRPTEMAGRASCRLAAGRGTACSGTAGAHCEGDPGQGQMLD
jgi:hypothetical protein